MKLSKYNIIHHRTPYTYWYNTFSKCFFRTSEESGRKIECLLNQLNSDTELPDFIVNKLRKGGFVLDDNADEISAIMDENKKSTESKDYFLVILPTLNCNYKCWYCIQDHITSSINDHVYQRICRHIERMINLEKITSLHIEWFGGEPLMYFNEIILPLSKYALDLCNKANIPFKNSATTNGFYLDKTIGSDLSSINMFQYQITLDGDQKFHDKVKYVDSCHSTFCKVLENIDYILSLDEKTHIILRINYTHSNLTSGIVEEVASHISRSHRRRIVITPRKVWQINVNHDFSDKLLRILDAFREAGFSVEYWSPIMNFIPCYANKKYYNAINFNGNVVKCTACKDLYQEKPFGALNNDGSIYWVDDYDKRYNNPSFINDKCLNCVHLPECMGVCPRDYVNGNTQCKQNKLDTPFIEALINYVDRVYE